ncbi:MAG TPA: ATP-binding protein [Polyangia bacterium]|nr:ATP-binding protein [Polyangia bacterium]
MKLDIRAKLFAVSLGLIVVSMIASEAYLRPAIESNLTDRMRSDLLARLSLVEHAADGVTDMKPESWDALADTLGARAAARVTFIAADGRVLGDSEVPLSQLAGLENHRDRPEVARALGGQPGASMRWSATIKDRLMYAAVPHVFPDGSRGAARLAVPLADVDAALRRLRHLLLAALAVALVVAIIMSSGAAHLLSGALRQMTDVARRMSSGDLQARTRVTGTDEIAELGRALDHLAGSLSTTLGELRGERDLLGRILQSMREGVLVLDADRRILLVNPALRNTLLLGPAVEGKAPLEAIRNADLQEILERAFSANEATSGEIEVGGLTRKRLLVHASPLPPIAGDGSFAGDGEAAGLLAVFVDVTEIRRLETLRKDFVANVSHELRTPVTAVRSAVETLRHTLERDQTSSVRFVDMIDRNAQRLGSLVEDLLDLSRIESQEYKPALEALPLRPAAEQVVSLLRAKVDQKRQRLVLEVPPEGFLLRADRRALEQVLTNLVDNAVKYCPTGASITLRARVVGEGAEARARVEVADTGPGIEPRHQPRLFERFYRVDGGRSRDMGGTGLGLSIVKHLVEAMNGAVGVESSPGRGSLFWFTVPLAGGTERPGFPQPINISSTGEPPRFS